MTELAIIILGIVCFFVSTLAAGGGAMVVLPFATLFLTPRQISPALAVASVISSIQRCIIYYRFINRKIVSYNVLGLILGSLLGGLLLKTIKPTWVLYLVALFLIFEPVRFFVRRGQRTFKMRIVYFSIASFITSFISTLVGTAGPFMNPFYLNADVVKEEMIGTKAASTLLMQILKVAIFTILGLLTPKILYYGALLGIGALVGNFLGKLALERMRVIWFKSMVQIFLLGSGSLLLLKMIFNY